MANDKLTVTDSVKRYINGLQSQDDTSQARIAHESHVLGAFSEYVTEHHIATVDELRA